MLVVLTADRGHLDAGSVTLALARRWSEAAEQVLFVDADVTGSRLAQRYSDAVHADYSPARRGLPSLIVARERLSLKLLADHCYSLDTAAGSLWALFAPDHPEGGQYAAGWLAQRADELAAVDTQRTVVVSSSLPQGATRLAPLARNRAAVVVVLAPVESLDAAKALWTLLRDLGLPGARCPHRALIVEGDSPLDDDEIGIEAGMNVAGRLPVVDDDRMLRPPSGRRDRAFAASLDEIAGRILAFSRLASAPRTGDETPAAPGLAALAASPQQLGVNGADAAPGPVADHVHETSGEGRL